ncbi:hypothetical protein [Thalassovita mangrovi]|uniref:Beta-xylosidase n=1 Tax=Thalassovita mangrovi TaxID=2692236 RepID=A0A6L8LSW4_9RHOB|nr:hypothetical protein [Thalassovita mangrovi]MYM56259.1 hypothetical protein [Thalassovita mangrovi]
MTGALWSRKGMFLTAGGGDWISHAQVPTVLPLSDRLWRIFFGGRDAANRSRTFAADVDPSRDMEIRALYRDPVFPDAAPGRFDCDGTAPSCLRRQGDDYLLYYSGIRRDPDRDYNTQIGLARSGDGLDFGTHPQPIGRAHPGDRTPFVLAEKDGYRVWFVADCGPPEAFRYGIRTCFSPDGITWDESAVTAVPVQGGFTAQIRPWVTEWQGQRRLWFSERGDDFRKGGTHPYRVASCPVDEQGVACGPVTPVAFENPPRPGDFDDWMQGYAAIVPHGEGLIMVYNGNDFGRDGIGWAMLEQGADHALPL